jgi:Tfp pilus assembly protein PilN
VKPTLDFIATPRPPRRGWALLGAGVAALLAAFQLDAHWAEQRARAERLRQAAETRLQAEARRPVAAPSPETLRLQRAVAETQRPWLEVLQAIEAVADEPVYLLSLSVQSAGTIKIEAEAPTFDRAVAFTRALNSGPISSAIVTAHQQAGVAASGERQTVKFTASAEWR